MPDEHFSSAAALEAYLHERGILASRHLGGNASIELLSAGSCRFRRWPGEGELRLGIPTGPTMFLTADAAALVMALSRLAPGSGAVTSSATITFLRRPTAGPLAGEATLLKFGPRLVVSDIRVTDQAETEVAHALISWVPPLARPVPDQ